MKMIVTTLLVVASATLALGQRPFFAGTQPIGYPIVTTTEGLGDRFGEVDGTTSKLPIEANGDRDLVDRLSKLPIDKQPFWFINWQAYEEHRQKPQTYPQKPNEFVDPVSSNFSPDDVYSNSESLNLNPGNVNPNSDSPSLSTGNVNSNLGSSNSNFGSSSSNVGSSTSNFASSNSNSGSVASNTGSANVNVVASGAASGFVSSDRFGEDEAPKKPDNKLETAFTNPNPTNDYSNAAGVLLSLGNKKKPLKDNKTKI